MSSCILYGRKNEQRELDRLYRSQQAEFLAIYGRRRVGKTHLIHQYFHDKGIYFEVTGIHKAALSLQLENFATVFSDVFFRGQKKYLLIIGLRLLLYCANTLKHYL